MNQNLIISASPHRSFYASGLLAFISLMSVLRLLAILKVAYYPTINRVTYLDGFTFGTVSGFANIDSYLVLAVGIVLLFLITPKRSAVAMTAGYIIGGVLLYQNQSALDALSLSILPTVVGLLFVFRNRAYFSITKYVLVLISILALIESYSLVRLMIYPMFPASYFSDWSWRMVDLERQIFYVTALVAPPLMLLVVFSFVLKINLTPIRNIAEKLYSRINALAEHNYKQVKDDANDPIRDILNNRLLWFGLAAFFSVLVPLYPYLPSLNPDQSDRATDIQYYAKWVEDLDKTNNVQELISRAFFDLSGDQLSVGRGDRPLTLLFILLLYRMLDVEVVHLVQLFPIILTPLLVFVTFAFVRYAGMDKQLSAIAGIFTVASYHVIIGIYTGFLANWLAVICNYGAFLFLLLAWNNKKKSYYFLFAIMTIMSMLAHLHTWLYLSASIVMFLTISIVAERGSRQILKKVSIVALLLIPAFMLDTVFVNIFNASSVVSTNIERAGSALSFENYAQRWNTLYYNFTVWFGGFYANFGMLLLALVGILTMNWRRSFDRLLISLIFVTALIIVFGDYGIQARLFYMMPVHILAAFGLLNILTSRVVSKKIKVPLLILANAYLLTYAIWAVGNLQLKIS